MVNEVFKDSDDVGVVDCLHDVEFLYDSFLLQAKDLPVEYLDCAHLPGIPVHTLPHLSTAAFAQHSAQLIHLLEAIFVNKDEAGREHINLRRCHLLRKSDGNVFQEALSRFG